MWFVCTTPRPHAEARPLTHAPTTLRAKPQFAKPAPKPPTETVHGAAVPNYMKDHAAASHSAHVEIPHEGFKKPAPKPATVPVHDVPSYMLPRPGH